jgi:hypothetical protein
VLYFCQIVFREWAAGQLLELVFALSKFIAECTQCISPGVALSGKLRDVCLNHGINDFKSEVIVLLFPKVG